VTLLLSSRELDRVFELQVWLAAIKVCEMCSLWLGVEEFHRWGAQPCRECLRAKLQAHGLIS